MREVNYYEAADKAIAQMDRENLRAFGRLKLAKFEELQVIRTITQTYLDQAKKAKKRYYGIAIEAYLLGLFLCGVKLDQKAHRDAEKAITMEWVEELLEEVEPTAMYQFDREADRKAQRLIEILTVAEDRGKEIDKALKAWTKQLAWFAIVVTDAAVVQAMEDAGIEGGFWITERDQRGWGDCHQLDGRWFQLEEVPRKPHIGCRCRLQPARKP